MKSSRDLKVGVTLLVIALAVGVFALVVWADGNGMYGMRGGSNGNTVTPRYGMENKEFSNQMQNQDCEVCEDCVGYLGSGMVNRNNAPDDDGEVSPTDKMTIINNMIVMKNVTGPVTVNPKAAA